MKHALALSFTLVAFWLLLSGHYTTLLLTLGAASVALVSWIAHRMDIVDHEGQPWHMGARGPLYLPWLFAQVLLSAWDITRRIWGAAPVRPARRRTAAAGLSDLGRVIYATSVTLTPGTLTLDVDEDSLEVHSLDAGLLDDLDRGGMLGRVRGLDAR